MTSEQPAPPHDGDLIHASTGVACAACHDHHGGKRRTFVVAQLDGDDKTPFCAVHGSERDNLLESFCTTLIRAMETDRALGVKAELIWDQIFANVHEAAPHRPLDDAPSAEDVLRGALKLRADLEADPTLGNGGDAWRYEGERVLAETRFLDHLRAVLA